jgi:hypothetical protein
MEPVPWGRYRHPKARVFIGGRPFKGAGPQARDAGTLGAACCGMARIQSRGAEAVLHP